ncbi:HNH endonuclease signature motif containing protein [Achromobacter xylosoxidans]|uniref:HNH endonuclease signature motif containing protein n=1 Tax=Alcaligenes xylosoxydans xylosoxydans TaxID=85698 RepID=UPI0019D582DF|nr:HNH endonuclease signature motif containing protein [Achromobacter xylosoxidans]
MRYERAAWPLQRRIDEKIVKASDGCWNWTGTKQKTGHGRIKVDKRNRCAHRVVFELLRGSIPDGLVLDHLCRNPSCVNPEHLEPVTQRENLLRGKTIIAANAAKTHCPHGHPYAGDNLKINVNGQRVCVTCSRISDKKYNAKRNNHAF